MASKSSNTTIEYDFVENPSKDYFCPVTFEILTDPQQTNFCCGNHISREAAERLKREKKSCPFCNCRPLKTTDDLFFKKQVLALKIRCKNKALGCEWVGELGKLAEHMKVESVEGKCEYVLVSCQKCGNEMQRRSLRVHESDKCVKRPFTCKYCSYKGTYEKVTRDHWPQCQKYPLTCPNKCCEENIERRFLERHLDQDCPLEEIECEFSYAGCGAKMQRRMMQEHMDKNEGKHLCVISALGKNMIEEVQSRLHALSVKIAEPIFIQPPDIVLENFEQHRKENSVWYSSSFYNHIGGYKMCLRIHANGWRDTKDTHVSVFLCMMKGEFDDHLLWPFKGVVTIHLINQREGGKHVERNIVKKNDKTENNLCRVLEGDTFAEGWGREEFIHQTNLYKPERGWEYLMNDTLKFRVVSVDVKSI